MLEVFLLPICQGRSEVHTLRHRCVRIDVVMMEWMRYARGWFTYFGIGPNKDFFDKLDGWMRRCMRAFLLKQWRKPEHPEESQEDLISR